MCQQSSNESCGVTASMYTSRGHVVGMLDRDQRTAKIPSFSKTISGCCTKIDDFNETVDGTIVYRENSLKSTAPSKTHKPYTQSGRKKNCLWKCLQRLKQVLVVGTYLLSIVSIPSSLSAPTNRHMADRINSHPKWINPCGIRAEDKEVLQDAATDIPRLSDKDLVTQIVSQASIALRNANQFKEEFTLKTFNSDSTSFHELWKTKHYDWLPSVIDIPKSLGENISNDSPHFSMLSMDSSLIQTYQHLQKIAVGLEQIVWDQEDNHGPFQQNFTETEYNLRSLLCEIQMAIIELGLEQNPDIIRDQMGNEFRNMDTTSRNLRDWLIYRDYMNALEYTIQVFKHIRSKL